MTGLRVDALPPGVQMRVGSALRLYIAAEARNGRAVPAELAGLAAELTTDAIRDRLRNRAERERELARARMARSRARRRGEDVPLRRPGRRAA